MTSKEKLIADLDSLKNHLHRKASEIFHIQEMITGKPQISDPDFVDLCQRANEVAKLRNRIYNEKA